MSIINVCDEISIRSRINVHAMRAYADSHSTDTFTHEPFIGFGDIEKSNRIQSTNEWLNERTHKNVEHVEKEANPSKHMSRCVLCIARFLIIDYPSLDK